MKDFGFKKLDEKNWLEPDQLLEGFQRIQSDGSTKPLTISEWFSEINKVKLEDSVPDEIHKLFEVARGSMSYGYFFYPIFTFSSEQFTRIAETAINMKCVNLNLPKSRNTFKKKVNWLSENSFISNNLYNKWESIISLRNKFSHPSRQNIITPFMAINLMDSIATIINQLYNVSG